MDVLLVVSVLGAIGGLGAAVWLALGRAKLSAECAAKEAMLAAMTRERDAARAEAGRVMGELKDAGESLARLGADVARLNAELDGEQAAHRETRGRLHELHKAELAKIDGAWAARLEKEKEVLAERVASIQQQKELIETKVAAMERQLREAFGAMASAALKDNQQQFIALAEQKFQAKHDAVQAMVSPITETLKKTDAKLAVIESAGTHLREQTGKLLQALREPHVRGRYGELQLKRVAELAGMAGYCDFTEQDQTRDADGQALRPDMIVRLPNTRTIVVDAKTNIQAYLDAMSAASPDEAEAQLERFARHVSEQAMALARKKYWSQYDGSPEFVVMFIPGDQFIDAALSRQPQILERAAEQGVLLASPSTLIGLLRAVAVGYREQQIATAAAELRELGKELHDRVATALQHAAQLGKKLEQAIEHYNDFVGSYERRVEPTLRKFEESGVKSAKTLPEPAPVVVKARAFEAEPGQLLPGMKGIGVGEG